jgi:hypothetical protein
VPFDPDTDPDPDRGALHRALLRFPATGIIEQPCSQEERGPVFTKWFSAVLHTACCPMGWWGI